MKNPYLAGTVPVSCHSGVVGGDRRGQRANTRWIDSGVNRSPSKTTTSRAVTVPGFLSRFCDYRKTKQEKIFINSPPNRPLEGCGYCRNQVSFAKLGDARREC